jgi:hypothetical protein
MYHSATKARLAEWCMVTLVDEAEAYRPCLRHSALIDTREAHALNA